MTTAEIRAQTTCSHCGAELGEKCAPTRLMGVHLERLLAAGIQPNVRGGHKK